MPTSFFLLPRELRDEVYHYLWLSTPAIDLMTGHESLYALYSIRRSDTAGWVSDYSPIPSDVEPDSTTGLPTWLASSKLILAEGLSQFNLRGALFFRPFPPHLDGELAMYELSVGPEEIFPSLLAPATCRRMVLDLCGTTAFSLGSLEAEYLDRVFEHVSKQKRMKALFIRSAECYGLQGREVGGEVRPLGSVIARVMPQVDGLEFHLTVSLEGRGWPDVGAAVKKSIMLDLEKFEDSLVPGLMKQSHAFKRSVYLEGFWHLNCAWKRVTKEACESK